MFIIEHFASHVVILFMFQFLQLLNSLISYGIMSMISKFQVMQTRHSKDVSNTNEFVGYFHLQMSNGDMYENNHDELDFEFLGNIRGKEWRIQTNVYGNGSTNVGREERYTLWFDPSEEFHRYSILWVEDQIM